MNKTLITLILMCIPSIAYGQSQVSIALGSGYAGGTVVVTTVNPNGSTAPVRSTFLDGNGASVLSWLPTGAKNIVIVCKIDNTSCLGTVAQPTGNVQDITAALQANPVGGGAGGSFGPNYSIGGGTAQAQTVAPTTAVTNATLVDGYQICWSANAANTGAAPTLAGSGSSTFSAHTIVKSSGSGTTALIAGDIVLLAPYACAHYNLANTQFILDNPQAGLALATSISVGSSPPTAPTAGTAGAFGLVEGTAPSGGGVGPGNDWWWANLTSHCMDEIPNGAELGCALVANGVNTFGTAGTLDMSTSTVAGAFKTPVGAGLTAAANGVIAYDTTAGAEHTRCNGADCLIVGEATAIAANFIPKATNSTNSLVTASLCDEGVTTANRLTCANTDGIASPRVRSTTATAGFIDYAQGSTSSGDTLCATATSWCVQAGTAMTAGVETLLGTHAQGVFAGRGTSAAIQDVSSGDTLHSATVTTGSGTSIGSTSLCLTADCPPGTYVVHVYIDITTACSTSGTYVVNLIYTDDQGAKTIPVNINGTGAVPATGVLTTTSTANFGENSQVLRLTSGNLNYSTTAVACGSGGPMVGKLYMAAVPVM